MNKYYNQQVRNFSFRDFLRKLLRVVPRTDELTICQFSKSGQAKAIKSPQIIAGPNQTDRISIDEVVNKLQGSHGDTDFLEATEKVTTQVDEAVIWLLTDNINDPTGGGGDQSTLDFYNKIRDPRSPLRRIFAYPIITGWNGTAPASGLMLYSMLFARKADIPAERASAFDNLIRGNQVADLITQYNRDWPHTPMWLKPLDEGTVRIEALKTAEQVPHRKLSIVRDPRSKRLIKIAGKGFHEGEAINFTFEDALIIKNYLHPYDIVGAKLSVTSTLLSTEEGFNIPEEQKIDPAEVTLQNPLKSDGSIPVQITLRIPKHSVKINYRCLLGSIPKPDPSHFENNDYGRLQYEVAKYRYEHCLASVFESSYKIKGFLHLSIPGDPTPTIRIGQRYRQLLLAIAGGGQLPEFFQPLVGKINEKFRDRFAIPVEITVDYGWHRFALIILAGLLVLLLPALVLYFWLHSARYAVAVNDVTPVNILLSPLRKYSVDAPKELDERNPKRLGTIRMGVLRNIFFESVPEASIASSNRRTTRLSPKGSKLDLEYKLPRPDPNGRRRFSYTLKLGKADRRIKSTAGKTRTASGKYY